jgi:hypothetical protein
MGADRTELLAAAETGLVESSGFHNLPGGDADSAGWRQERASLYPEPTNVEVGARNFFKEVKSQSGATAGELAANVQRPAEQYRGRYDEVKPEAAAILKAFERGGLKPGEQRKLAVTKAKAQKLGLKVGQRTPDLGLDPKTKTVKVRADAKGMVKWAESVEGETEGSAKTVRWGAEFGLNPVSQPWCANFVSNGLARRGITNLPSNPNYVPSYESEWAEYAVPGGLAKAKPGDLVTFSGAHIGIFVGNGEMISGNSSDAVSRTPVGEPSMVIRPPYKGGFVKVKESTALPGSTNPTASLGASSAPAAVGLVSSPSTGSQAGREIAKARLTPLQKYNRTKKQLHNLGVGESSTATPRSSDSVLSSLERKYLVAAA